MKSPNRKKESEAFYRRVSAVNTLAVCLIMFGVAMCAFSFGGYYYMAKLCGERHLQGCINEHQYLLNAGYYIALILIFAGAAIALNVMVSRKGQKLEVSMITSKKPKSSKRKTA